VSNAVVFAPGDNRLDLSLDSDGLTIGVSDRLPAGPVRGHPVHARGLAVVDELSDVCGTTHHHTGKTVWAPLRATPASDHP
jgi:hypothetical protein